MLTLEGITKFYGEIKAVESVSMQVKEGEILGLVGPNGSGKSTLLKIMLGILKPSSGRVLVNGKELTERDWREFRRRIGYMPERVSFYDNLTGLETLRFFARLKGGSVGEFVKRIIPENVLKRKVGGYSKGMRQRLNLAQALLNEPDILILDEPTSGLDPVGTMEFYGILDEVRERKTLTVVLSSHILAEIEDRTDRVAVIKNGTLRAIGSLEELYHKLNLPLRVSITLKQKDPLLEEILKSVGATDLMYRNGYLLARIPAESKIRMLSAMMSEKDRFTDLSIREPNLEEVFFGIH